METLIVDNFNDVCLLNWDIESSACFKLVRGIYKYVNRYVSNASNEPLTKDMIEEQLVRELMVNRVNLANRDFMNDYAYLCDRVMNDCFELIPSEIDS